MIRAFFLIILLILFIGVASSVSFSMIHGNISEKDMQLVANYGLIKMLTGAIIASTICRLWR